VPKPLLALLALDGFLALMLFKIRDDEMLKMLVNDEAIESSLVPTGRRSRTQGVSVSVSRARAELAERAVRSQLHAPLVQDGDHRPLQRRLRCRRLGSGTPVRLASSLLPSLSNACARADGGTNGTCCAVQVGKETHQAELQIVHSLARLGRVDRDLPHQLRERDAQGRCAPSQERRPQGREKARRRPGRPSSRAGFPGPRALFGRHLVRHQEMVGWYQLPSRTDMPLW
jgi:hypothetical protein